MNLEEEVKGVVAHQLGALQVKTLHILGADDAELKLALFSLQSHKGQTFLQVSNVLIFSSL